jgi:hypothetical protein
LEVQHTAQKHFEAIDVMSMIEYTLCRTQTMPVFVRLMSFEELGEWCTGKAHQPMSA